MTLSKVYKTQVKMGTFGPVKATRCPWLNYQRQINCWRLIDSATDHPIGPAYGTKAELLADLDRYATAFGCD